MDKTSLGDRIKDYESLSDFRFMKRLPIMIRLDGHSFSRLTKCLKLAKPFDPWFMSAMTETMVSIASQLQGCILGYTQSDEISLALINHRTLNAEPYFGNRIQKINSITTSMATARFNRLLESKFDRHIEALFDSRIFTVPTAIEAMNVFIWRQQDCVRNSILGSAYYEISKVKGRKTAQKMMFNLDTSKLQELLFQELGINWSDYAPELKRGTITYRKTMEIETPNGKAIRHKWVTEPAPVFQSEEGKAWLLSLLDVTPIKESANN